MKKLYLFISLIALIFHNQSYSQLNINNVNNPQELAENLAGYNINVSNASVSGNALQSGTFTFNGNGLDVSSGVILSTGNIFDAQGPNSSSSTSTSFWGPGHPLLTALAGYQTNDAVVLEFDFQVQTERVEFNYIFLSEEYNEWVNSSFNDVFAFFISGPGINGVENLAVVPGTTVPVSINTINNQSYWQFYNDNESGGTNIEFDGFTTLMTAEKDGLIPCETYTLKLMIADGSDAIYDAGVLLQENSLVQANISANASTYSDNDTALEGCIEANFIFELEQAMNEDTYIPIKIGGTATNGVDYNFIDSLIMIPAGQTTAQIILDTYADGLTEGQETVEIIYTPEPCGQYDTAFLYIDDYQPIEYTTTVTDAKCHGSSGEVLFDVAGGIPEYSYQLTDTINGDVFQYNTNPVTGIGAGTYKVDIIDGFGCDAEDIISGGIFDAGQTFLPDGNGQSYSTSIDVSGFTDNQTIISADQVESICASIEHSYSNDLSIILEAPDGSQVLLKDVGPSGGQYNTCNMGEPVASGPVDQWNSSNVTPGIGYNYCWNNNPTYPTMNDLIQSQNIPYYTYVSTFGNTLSDYYLPEGAYTPVENFDNLIGAPLNGMWSLIVTDNYPLDNGYIFEWSISLSANLPDSVFTISEPEEINVTHSYTEPDCGVANGGIDLTVSGTAAPYSYLWSNGETTQNISNITAGTYTVAITGADTCTYEYTYNLSNNTAPVLEATIVDEICYGANNGSIDLSVSNGAEPYSFDWSNGSITEDITNLSPGEYQVTVTDNNGCIAVQSFIVNSASKIKINGEVEHEYCGDEEGSIDISVNGGVPPYTFNWNNGANTEDIDELSQGEYIVTVTDQNNCTQVANFTINNYVGNCIPNCDLAISNATITNEYCGNDDGAIDLTIFTSNYPYNVEWSSGQTTEDISMLSKGNYTVTITDAENCELTQTYTINNETGNFDLVNINTIHETCGNQGGAVDITVNGGALPYSYQWSNGSTTEDINNLHAGNYSVEVTDANNCKIDGETQVQNQAGTLELAWYFTVNEECGNSNGSIDILVEGGTPPYSYNWMNEYYTEDLTNISAGTYYCTITDATGCSLVTPDFIIENESGSLNISDIDIDHEVCGNGQGEIELTVENGAQPYSYNWSNGATTQNIYGLTAGTYSATVTDNSGCSTNTGNINVNNNSGTLHLAEINIIDETCSNSAGAIDISIEGDAKPFLYSWNNGSISEDLSNIPAGNYTCSINDTNGCEIAVNATVNNSQGTLEIINNIVSDETCGTSNGSIDQVVSGGTPPISYNWNTGQTTEDISGLSSGTYTCTITDAQGCQIENSVSIQNNSGSLSLDNYIITNEQCGNSDGAIDQVISGSAVPITYNWSNGETTQDISGLSAGTYSCVITDNIGCQINGGPYVINNTSQSLIIEDIAVTDENCGNGTGSIDITISGGSEPFTYLWSNGETTEDISGLSAGTYTFTVTDGSGCTISGSAEVDNNAGTLEIQTYSVTNETCSNAQGEIDITVDGGTEPYAFNWSNGANTEDISGLQAGSYSVTITDNDNCQVHSNSMYVANDPGDFNLVSIEATDETCSDSSGTITVELSGGAVPINYSWNNGSTTKDLISLTQGVYSCTTTDANGCILNYSETVYNQPGDLQVDDIIVENEYCGNMDGSLQILASGGTQPYSYLWSNGDTTQTIENLNNGTYTCVVTDSNGCTTTANETIEDIGGDFAIINMAVTHEICTNNQGEIDLTATGGSEPYSFQWSNGFSTEDISNLPGGTYSVNVTDANGCTDIDSAQVNTLEGDLEIANATITDEFCNDGNGEIDLTITGGSPPLSFYWSNGATIEDISFLSSGYYSVSVTDNNGCIDTATYFVENVTNGFEIADAQVTHEYCSNSNGAIDLTIVGGITPYSFLWSNGATTEDIAGLTAGTYSCDITDDMGCTISITKEVENQTNGLALSLNQIEDDYCNGYNGMVDINVSGGVEPYTFEWNNGVTTEDLTGITAGTYSVTLTDEDGCILFGGDYVVDNIMNDDIEFSNFQVTNDYCNQGYGVISFDAVQGSNSLVYKLNGVASNQPIFENLYKGDYEVEIVDEGCTADSNIYLSNYATFQVSNIEITDEFCGDGTGAIDITVTPASGNYSYQWSDGSNTQDINNLNSGIYSCTISDDNGCQDYITVEVENQITFTVESEVTDEVCGQSNGMIDLTVTTTAPPINYLWSNGETTEDLVNIAAGTYTCTITDDSGCEQTVEFVLQNNTGSMTVIPTVYNDVCNEALGAIELDINGVPAGYEVLWSTGATTDNIYNLTEGNYSVTVTDLQNNCDYYNEFVVENMGSYYVTANITPASGINENDGSIDLTLNPGDSYTFSWSNGATSEDITGILPGDYSVIIVNNDGCEVSNDYVVGYQIGENLVKGDAKNINVYPNPTTGKLFIEYNLEEDNCYKIDLLSPVGKSIFERELKNKKGLLEIDMQKYMPGIYLLKYMVDDNPKYIKVIKTNN